MVTLVETLPAWFQAIGSAGAIYVAGRTVILTSRTTRRDKLNGVDAIFMLCAELLEEADEAFKITPDFTTEVSLIDDGRFANVTRMLLDVSSSLVDIGSERLPAMTAEALALIRDSESSVKTAKQAIGLGIGLGNEADVLAQAAPRMRELQKEVHGFAVRQIGLVKNWWRPSED